MSGELDEVNETVARQSGRLAAWWFAPVPARRIAVCRTVTFAYAAVWLVVRAPYVWDVAGLPATRFEPVGVFAGLDMPPSRTVVMCVWGLALAASVLAAAGRSLRLATSVGSISMLCIATYTSSFGQVFHTEHLVVIHLLVLAAGPPAAGVPRDDAERSGWSLNLMMSTVVVAYVVAGIAKLRYAGKGWLTGEVLRNWVAVDNLRKILLDDPASTLGGWLAGVEWVWAPVAVVTLIVELGAPAALFPGRVRAVWLLAAWLFHVGVFALMAITFPYQLSGVAYVAFLRADRIEAWLHRNVPMFRHGTGRSSKRRSVSTALETGHLESSTVRRHPRPA